MYETYKYENTNNVVLTGCRKKIIHQYHEVCWLNKGALCISLRATSRRECCIKKLRNKNEEKITEKKLGNIMRGFLLFALACTNDRVYTKENGEERKIEKSRGETEEISWCV